MSGKLTACPLVWLWLIVLLPKPVQLMVFAGLLLGLCIQARWQVPVNVISCLVGLYAVVQLLAVVANSSGQDPARIMAAVNTVAIWLVALGYFAYFRQVPVDMAKLQRAAYLNLTLLLIVGLAYWFTQKLGVSTPEFLGRRLANVDWINGEYAERLMGYMEYANAIVIFYLCQLPLAFAYVQKRFAWLLASLWLAASMLPAIWSHSRAGIVVVGVCVATAIGHLLIKRTNTWLALGTSAMALVAIVGIVMKNSVVQALDSVLATRAGSTSMRTSIYQTSIDVTLRQSPVIGMGIKTDYYGFPLGSHSTYIGWLYKAGFAGLILMVLAVLGLSWLVLSRNLKQAFGVVVVICFLGLLGYFAIEDMDGTNWGLVLFWLMCGLWTKALPAHAILEGSRCPTS